MLSFFTILLVLVGANALFMVFSLSGIANGSKKSEKNAGTSDTSKIGMVEDLQARFKKAV